MFERIYIWFMEKPVRMIGAGKFLLNLSGSLIVLGAIARAALVALSLGRAPMELASLGLPFPTFFIPETWLGFACCAALLVAGARMRIIGRSWQRMQVVM